MDSQDSEVLAAVRNWAAGDIASFSSPWPAPGARRRVPGRLDGAARRRPGAGLGIRRLHRGRPDLPHGGRRIPRHAAFRPALWRHPGRGAPLRPALRRRRGAGDRTGTRCGRAGRSRPAHRRGPVGVAQHRPRQRRGNGPRRLPQRPAELGWALPDHPARPRLAPADHRRRPDFPLSRLDGPGPGLPGADLRSAGRVQCRLGCPGRRPGAGHAGQRGSRTGPRSPQRGRRPDPRPQAGRHGAAGSAQVASLLCWRARLARQQRPAPRTAAAAFRPVRGRGGAASRTGRPAHRQPHAAGNRRLHPRRDHGDQERPPPFAATERLPAADRSGCRID